MQANSPLINILRDMPVGGWFTIFNGTETIRLEFKHPCKNEPEILYIRKRHQKLFANNLRLAADALEGTK